MKILNMLFEEDIAMADAIDDIEDFADDSTDIIIGAIEDRYAAKKETETHLFEDEDEVNEDGLTAEEENEINVAILNGEIDADELVDDDEFDDIDD